MKVPTFCCEADPARDAATQALNEKLREIAVATPGLLRRPPHIVRAERRAGEGNFQPPVFSQRARELTAEGSTGTVPLRVVPPSDGNARGVFLHLHGGGWSLGGADLQDPMLETIADGAGLACVSVDYRLAPEHSYPAGPDDCETAALWLARNAAREFGTERLFIGGDSSGGHLSAVTLLRLRDRHGLTPFSGACLHYGVYDLAFTPSARNTKDPPLLDLADMEQFRANFLQQGENLADPDISPLQADLAGLPPALFTCGTRDCLLDDTLFMAARWAAAGNNAEVELWSDGPHNFLVMDIPLARDSLANAIAWLKARAA